MKACPTCALKYDDESKHCLVDGAALVDLPDEYLGKTLGGRYQIEAKLGEGGMATVYRARHVLVDRLMAVKILGPHVANNPQVKERFRREAKNAAALSHPNIIEIYDHGETDGGAPYLVMELLVGHALSDRIEEGPIPAPEAAAIAWQAAQALARAHDFGVIHRDLKPENVFIATVTGRAVVKLLDFGIARSAHDPRLTNAGELFGTPQYMAPERLTSIDAGPSSDLYAFGVMLYEMLTGGLPFAATTLPAMFLAHMQEIPAPPSQKVRGIPPALEALVLSLLEKDPAQRPMDAHAVLRALEPWAPVDIRSGGAHAARAELHHTLPPTTLESWTRRTAIFDEMLRRAYAPSVPAELGRRLELVRGAIARIQNLRTEGVAVQRRLDVIDRETREARGRLGYAMQRVGQGLSEARAAVRALEQDDSLAALDGAERAFRAAAKALDGYGPASSWTEPHPVYAEAIDALSIAHADFLAAFDAATEVREAREAQRSDVADLEFQVQALREQLARVESTADQERAALEAQIATRTRDAEALEQQLTAHGTAIVDAVRTVRGLQDLFERLAREGSP